MYILTLILVCECHGVHLLSSHSFFVGSQQRKGRAFHWPFKFVNFLE